MDISMIVTILNIYQITQIIWFITEQCFFLYYIPTYWVKIAKVTNTVQLLADSHDHSYYVTGIGSSLAASLTSDRETAFGCFCHRKSLIF